MHIYLWVRAVYQATLIIKLMTKSTGIISPTTFGLTLATLRTPLAAPYIIPVGPLMLSTHPGMGSFTAPVTMDGRTITNGMSPCSSFNSCSAMPFVKV